MPPRFQRRESKSVLLHTWAAGRPRGLLQSSAPHSLRFVAGCPSSSRCPLSRQAAPDPMAGPCPGPTPVRSPMGLFGNVLYILPRSQGSFFRNISKEIISRNVLQNANPESCKRSQIRQLDNRQALLVKGVRASDRTRGRIAGPLAFGCPSESMCAGPLKLFVDYKTQRR